MFQFEQDAQLVDDKEDLIGILHMRFGELPPALIEELYRIDSYDQLERLILVASNAPTFRTFIEEMQEGKDSFKIVGDRFNPLGGEH